SALRRRCGLLPGDRVLLAMFPGQDAMAAYSFAVVGEGLRAERHFGYAVARAYAGHTDASGEVGATSTYVRASLSEVAAALAADRRTPSPGHDGWVVIPMAALPVVTDRAAAREAGTAGPA